MTRIYTLDAIRSLRAPLVEAGCTWILDRAAGTLVARSEGKVVLRALQHPTGSWLARHISAGNVVWSTDASTPIEESIDFDGMDGAAPTVLP